MPHSLLPAEMIARLSLRDGGAASWPKPSRCSEFGERNAGFAIVLSMKMRARGGYARWSRTDCTLRPPMPQSASAISATVPSERQRRG